MVVTKPGYGTFTECAVNDVPVLFLPRRGWVESVYLVDWLHASGRAVEISRADLFGPGLEQQLRKLLSIPRKALPDPTGVEEAVEAIEQYLAGTRCRQR